MARKRRIRSSEVVGVIPARWGSTRFPGKILTPIGKSPLLAHVIRGCRKSRRVSEWLVATDDARIAEVAAAAGATPVMTPTRLASGSDRVARAIRNHKARWILNWQGDEWLPDGRPVDRLVETLEADPDATVATLARPLTPSEAKNPNRVKVVLSHSGRALYFSRAQIPHDPDGVSPSLLHLGAYLFEREELVRFTRWRTTPLERQERLEQLRLLEHDVAIAVGLCRVQTIGIDTPSDAKVLRGRMARRRHT